MRDLDKKSRGYILDKHDLLWIGGLIGIVILTRIPFLDTGFGRADAWRVAVCGKFLVEMGEYFPSRPPGFPLLEILSAGSYFLFLGSKLTWVFLNAFTTVIFCYSVYLIFKLARHWNLSSPILIAVIYAFAPLNWVYSVETIDYVWVEFLLLSGIVILADKQRPGGKHPGLFHGLILSLAVAARFLAIVPAVANLYVFGKISKDNFRVAVITFTAGIVIFYGIVFADIRDWGNYFEWFTHLNKITSGYAETGGGVFVRKYLVPASSLFGPLASIGIIAGIIYGAKNIRNRLKERFGAAFLCILMCVCIMAPYLWHLHQNYWIPAIPFILLLLGMAVDWKYLLIIAIFVTGSNFPWWKQNVEGLGSSISGPIAPYQNVTIFEESKMRKILMSSVEELVNANLPDDWVIMSSFRLPLIQFYIPGIEKIEIGDNSDITGWRSPDGGPVFVYLLSPGEAGSAIESDFHVVYLPGIDSTYKASYDVEIWEVDGVEMLYREGDEGLTVFE